MDDSRNGAPSPPPRAVRAEDFFLSCLTLHVFKFSGNLVEKSEVIT
jgi:hypothetical protein